MEKTSCHFSQWLQQLQMLIALHESSEQCPIMPGLHPHRQLEYLGPFRKRGNSTARLEAAVLGFLSDLWKSSLWCFRYQCLRDPDPVCFLCSHRWYVCRYNVCKRWGAYNISTCFCASYDIVWFPLWRIEDETNSLWSFLNFSFRVYKWDHFLCFIVYGDKAWPESATSNLYPDSWKSSAFVFFMINMKIISRIWRISSPHSNWRILIFRRKIEGLDRRKRKWVCNPLIPNFKYIWNVHLERWMSERNLTFPGRYCASVLTWWVSYLFRITVRFNFS